MNAKTKIATGVMSVADLFKFGSKDNFLDASKITDWANPAPVTKVDDTKTKPSDNFLDN